MRVAEIHRYPVKSMQGERLMSAAVGELGIPGDRAWTLWDEREDVRTDAKRLPLLMSLRARFAGEPDAARRSPEVWIDTADGRFSSSAPDANERLSRVLAHPVSLRPLPELDPASPTTYFDAFPLLIMTTGGLRALARAARASGLEARFDVRRFRPNLLLETEDEGFVEDDWVGRRLTLGDVELAVEMGCARCVMTTHGFADLPREPRVLRAVARLHGGNLGVYASVRKSGRIRVGDEAGPVRN